MPIQHYAYVEMEKSYDFACFSKIPCERTIRVSAFEISMRAQDVLTSAVNFRLVGH